MPNLKQLLVSKLTNLYPFYSGSSKLRFLQDLAGTSNECLWAKVPGGEVRISLNEFIGSEVFYFGDLDPKVTWFCSKVVSPGDVVLDIGANIGIISLWLSKLVGSTGKVYSFEPNPNLSSLLEDTVVKNKVSNIHLNFFALGDEAGVMKLSVPESNVGQASLVRDLDLSCTTFDVLIQKLDDIEIFDKIPSIKLIKIDVEGFEFQALKGAEKLFNKNSPEAILFEFNDDSKGCLAEQAIFQFLNQFGYQFYSFPKSLLKMKLIPIDIAITSKVSSNDIVALSTSLSKKMSRFIIV